MGLLNVFGKFKRSIARFVIVGFSLKTTRGDNPSRNYLRCISMCCPESSTNSPLYTRNFHEIVALTEKMKQHSPIRFIVFGPPLFFSPREARLVTDHDMRGSSPWGMAQRTILVLADLGVQRPVVADKTLPEIGIHDCLA